MRIVSRPQRAHGARHVAAVGRIAAEEPMVAQRPQLGVGDAPWVGGVRPQGVHRHLLDLERG